jgi:hypothetical protein
MHYFGPWDDPDGAREKYNAEKDSFHARRKPRPDPEAVMVKALANSYLNHKKALLDAGELSPHTWRNYEQAAALLVGHFGKFRVVNDLGPDDFAELHRRRLPTPDGRRPRPCVARTGLVAQPGRPDPIRHDSPAAGEDGPTSNHARRGADRGSRTDARSENQWHGGGIGCEDVMAGSARGRSTLRAHRDRPRQRVGPGLTRRPEKSRNP